MIRPYGMVFIAIILSLSNDPLKLGQLPNEIQRAQVGLVVIIVAKGAWIATGTKIKKMCDLPKYMTIKYNQSSTNI